MQGGYIAKMLPRLLRFLMARIWILLFSSLVLSDSGCSHAVGSRESANRSRYPARWWEPVSKEGAPDWEILPQEAGSGEVILSKRQPDLGLLSNFAATPFEFRGQHFASLEGLWQSMLYPEGPNDPRATFPSLEWKFTRDQVARMTAFEAKAAGDLASKNMTKMGIDWVTFEGQRMEYKPAEPGDHYRLIVEATWEKVRQNPGVKAALLSTGDLVLKPDHHQEPGAPAAWHYFDILMEIRGQLQRQAAAGP
jgi:predicted NAD-dependent protein-ADP-ribosyltransferase YbiA (DUF1768 family)